LSIELASTDEAVSMLLAGKADLAAVFNLPPRREFHVLWRDELPLGCVVAAGHPQAEVHYVGTERGVETRLVPPTGFPYTFLDVAGLQRRLTPKNVWRNLALPWRLWRSVRAAKALLRALQPKVVVNLGGYGSFPATWAARRLGVPYVVVSYDRRRAGVEADGEACGGVRVAFEVALPMPSTPAPVRGEMVPSTGPRPMTTARRELGLPDRFVVGVVCDRWPPGQRGRGRDGGAPGRPQRPGRLPRGG
jgi:hypothetical protein